MSLSFDWADGVDVGDGRLVVGLQLLVRRERRRIGDLVGVLRLGERPDLRIGPRPGNLVAAAVFVRLQGKRHLGNRLSPVGRLGEKHRVPVGGAEDFRRNVHVGVPADHHVDVVDFRRHRSCHILLEKCGIPGHALGVETRVHERHHDVGAPRLHLGHVLLRRHNRVAKLEFAVDDGPVPHAHARSDEPDHSDFDSLPADGAVDEGVGRESRRLRAGFDDVGPQKGRLQLGAVASEDVEPVVEFVVAQRLSVVSDVVEGFRHGVRSPLQQLRTLRGHVSQRRPLNCVAVVDDQHGPFRLGLPGVLDNRGRPRHAELANPPLRIGLIAEIVPVVCVSMDVGGGHDGQIEGVARRRRRASRVRGTRAASAGVGSRPVSPGGRRGIVPSAAPAGSVRDDSAAKARRILDGLRGVRRGGLGQQHACRSCGGARRQSFFRAHIPLPRSRGSEVVVSFESNSKTPRSSRRAGVLRNASRHMPA